MFDAARFGASLPARVRLSESKSEGGVRRRAPQLQRARSATAPVCDGGVAATALVTAMATSANDNDDDGSWPWAVAHGKAQDDGEGKRVC